MTFGSAEERINPSKTMREVGTEASAGTSREAPRPLPDEPTRRDARLVSRGAIKRLKRFGRRSLEQFCLSLEALSAWIQRRILKTTFDRLRSQKHLDLPLEEMDRDLLGMYIRWNGHHVEKTVRYKKTLGRGWGKPQLLRAALDPTGALAPSKDANARMNCSVPTVEAMSL